MNCVNFETDLKVMVLTITTKKFLVTANLVFNSALRDTKNFSLVAKKYINFLILSSKYLETVNLSSKFQIL